MKIAPNRSDAYSNMGNILLEQGRAEEAYKCWTQALTLMPSSAAIHSNALLCLNYDNIATSGEVFKAHLEWAARQAVPSLGHRLYPNKRDPKRRLLIGYVTPDLRDHSVAYFLDPLLRNHNREEYLIYCYSDVHAPDDMTIRLRALIDVYRSTKGLSDDQFDLMVHEDRIDILVDLSGHTADNRLLVFAREPAPIQVTYLGYPNTTGMAAVDYRLTDAWADPPGENDKYYTEKLYRLPRGFLCYSPPVEAPYIEPLPLESNGHITFGSFNFPGKITPKVIATWACILNQVPGARLILKYRSFIDTSTCERYYQIFENQHIERHRIEFIGLTPSKAEHLSTYSRVDIALDTFPYNGTTTTCDSLWMGVPVIVLAGKRHAGRVGVSLLTQIGLDELIADSLEDYITLAIKLASNRDQLRLYRQTLREMLAKSHLCDGKSFTLEVEEAFRNMWSIWCSG